MKTNRRIISEQAYYNKQCDIYESPTLKMACNFAPTCYPANANKKIAKADNREYISFPSASRQGEYAFLSSLGGSKGEGNGTVYFSKDPDGKEWVKNTDGSLVQKTWFCAPLRQTVNQEMTLDQDQWFQSLKANQKNKYFTYTEGFKMNAAGNPSYELKKLKDLPEMAKMPNLNQVQDVFVWVMTSAPTQVTDASRPQKLIDDYFKGKLGYVELEDVPTGEEGTWMKMNLQDDKTYGSQFKTPYILYADPNKMTTEKFKEVANNILTASANALPKDGCRGSIIAYYKLYSDKEPISDGTLNTYKTTVRGCIDKYNFPFLKKKIDELKFANPVKTRIGTTIDYRLSQSNVRENRDLRIKNLLRESLLEIKEQKKKTLLEESKIVKGRLQFIFENSNLKTKKQKSKFCNELLSEMIYLNSQGYDRQVINEQFFDMLKGLFGNTGESILQYFKEYLADWLISSLTPLDPNGWVGGVISKTIGNTPIGDIPKLVTDCNFTTKILSKSIAEEAIDQLKQRAGMEGAFFDVLRNAVVESLEDSDLGQKIEGALGSVLCPMLSKVSGKMSDAADTMKKGALSLA